MNVITMIHPYKYKGQWVFDDTAVGLTREPFVSGADEIIERMTQNIPNAAKGFTLLFSATSFPGSHSVLEWRRSEKGGNWYYSPELNIDGWLCPALLRYFNGAPECIHVQFRRNHEDILSSTRASLSPMLR